MTTPDDAARTVTDAASGAPTGPDPRIELIFDEARRALYRQALRLESLRTRAGTIIAASFLGAQALRDRAGEEAGIWSIAGIVSLVIVIASIVFVLAPRDGWRFIKRTRRPVRQRLTRVSGTVVGRFDAATQTTPTSSSGRLITRLVCLETLDAWDVSVAMRRWATAPS